MYLTRYEKLFYYNPKRVGSLISDYIDLQIASLWFFRKSKFGIP